MMEDKYTYDELLKKVKEQENEIKVFKANQNGNPNDLFETLFTDSYSIKLIIDFETGQIINANKSACKFYGYSFDEITSMNINQINTLSPEELTEKMQHVKSEIRNYFHFKHKLKNGHIKDVEVRSGKILIDNKTCLYSIIDDITEKIRKDAELISAKEKAEESELKFRLMYENTSIGIASATLDFKIISANQAFCKMLGYAENELIGKAMQEYTHPEILEHNIELLKELINGKISHFQLEKQFIHKDGHTVYGLLNATLIKDTNNRPLYLLGNVQDFSGRKQAENEMIKAKERALQNERKFKNQFNFTNALTKYLPIPFFFKDTEARYLGCNPAFENFAGMQEKEIIGKTVYELWDTETMKLYHQKNIELINNEDEFQNNEIIIPDADNGKRTVNSYQAVFFDENNEPAGIVGVLIDITERKNVELLLRQNAARLKILYDLNQLSNTETSKIYDFALEKSLELCNSRIGFLGFLNEQESIVSIHAWSSSVMKMCEIKDKYFDFVVAEAGMWGEVVRQRKPLIINDFKAENPLKRGTPEGHVEIKNYLSIPVFDKDKIFAVLAVGNKETDYNQTDIQELSLLMEGVTNIVRQRRYEQEIFEMAERFKALHNASFGGIVIHDKGLIIECNQGLSEMTGYNYDELIGMDGLLLIAPETRDKALNNILAGYEKPYEAVGIRKNGELYPLQLEARSIPYKGKKVRTVELRDITESKQAEKDLIAAKEKAEEANKLKTEFLHNMSHEIRTPMNGIIGFSEMLHNPNITEEKRKYFSKIVQNSSHQLLRIIDDILEISTLETKQEKLNEEEFCLNDFLMELFSVFNIKSKEQNIPLYLKKEFHDEQSYIISDKTKLNKILSNLLENALKFTNDGFIELGYYLEKMNLILYIKDTGMGISPKNHQIIFERFSQEDKEISRKHGGLGLGLSICKANAELLGGDIFLDSEKGKGSIFYLTIPYKPLKTEDGSTLKTINDKQNTKYTVLVAEDEEVNYLFIEALFEDEIVGDYNLIHARNGQDAIEICAADNNIDLVLMDIKMPVMNGHEAAEKIKEKFPNLPVIAQTAYSTESDKQLALKHGCDDFISKPIDKEKLSELINKYILV